jgi:hypothetical protein
MQSVSSPASGSSLFFLPLAAAAFWARTQLGFWIVALPTAILAGALTYLLPGDQWVSWPVFTIIYSLFLDRWLRLALLETAPICEETDTLRHAIINFRFLIYAIGAYGLALLMPELPVVDIAMWSLIVAPLLLVLPALSANEELGLAGAWRIGRPVQVPLLMIVLVTAALSFLAHRYAPLLLEFMPPRRSWPEPLVAGAARLVDCFLLAIAGHMLASLFRAITGWMPPEPDDRPYRLPRRRIS